MRSERDGLIAGIYADRENGLPRLVFADWCEENREAAWPAGAWTRTSGSP